MDKLLRTISAPSDLKRLSVRELQDLAAEMRAALCRLAATRTAHFASNLGVVELALALHTTFDFSRDRLIWDTGHQIYPHKMITGRYPQFDTIRTRGGLMGYPNPEESLYDLFVTGHAGTSVSAALGLKCGDDLARPDEDRRVVAVIGDGAFSCGLVFEAMNSAGGLKKRLIVILNDNKMSISPRVGGLAEHLDRIRMHSFYGGLKSEVQKVLGKVPLVGGSMERLLGQMRAALKAGMLGGMLFEELGFRYIGPVDGHNIRQLQRFLTMVQDTKGPILLHVVTEKGHGFAPAAEDPETFHAPRPFRHENGFVVPLSPEGPAKSYTELSRDTILAQMRANPRVVAITAAMCQGTMLDPVRDEFPNRFFDVGICESHAVAFAAGLAKAGMRPIVDIYSTFLQRSYDQVFQELALQNLPVVLLMDRAGIVGPDGPTHHGMFDLAYLRHLPNLVLMAPGDAADLPAMLEFALTSDGPTAIRFPKTQAVTVPRKTAPVKLGAAEVLHRGRDGMIVACGTLLEACMGAAKRLAGEGLDVGVINARFVKPLDTRTILRAVAQYTFVVTVEEACLQGGFGSAVLEAASDEGLDAGHVRRMGIPDRFIEHGGRKELLDDLGLSAAGIAATCLEMQKSRDPAHQVAAS